MINELLASPKHPDPEVGMGASILYHSDRHAATIVAVDRSTRGNVTGVWVQRDETTVVSGSPHDGSAKYHYRPSPENPRVLFTLRKNGRYVAKGESARDGTALSIGVRSEYWNPSF